MAHYDDQTRTLTIKLVYYGPALAGKTTNLAALHDILSPDMKGEMMVLETRNDRTLFFDLLPLGFRTPAGALVKFKLYTVPGQVQHDSTRKAVLSRTDGVVFVADSQRNQVTNNAESFENLADNTQRVGIDIETLPLVVQFNKRDLPDILSEEDIRKRWGEAPWPMTFASALKQSGVKETFALLLRAVFLRLQQEQDLHQLLQLDADGFVRAAMGDT